MGWAAYSSRERIERKDSGIVLAARSPSALGAGDTTMTECDRTLTTEAGTLLQTETDPMRLFEIPQNPLPLPVGRRSRKLRDYEWPSMLPLVLIHLGALYGLWLGASWEVWVLCFALYFIRMFAVTGVYHRYFSHRTYKTSRWLQFVLAFLAETSSQRGVLWWAAHHRDHHKYSDTEKDVHSPRHTGFWHAHIGWIYDHNGDTNYARVKDLTRYPELVALNKLWVLPPTILGFSCWLVFGWPGLFIGFMMSTVLLWHGTFTINSLSHVFGNQRYATGDDSRNNWLLALITMGEGWHNNHHHFMGSTRQGFFWWEVDLTYYVLKAMSWLGLVWDLKEPPARVYERTEGADVPAEEAA
jgi:stearoyl-CoA desaturase (Delta-9 desaturase)